MQPEVNAVERVRAEVAAKRWAGDLIAMHSGVLSVEPKKLRVIHRMTRVEDGKPVMNAKALMLGMDLERRKSAPLDDAMLVRARALVVDEGAA